MANYTLVDSSGGVEYYVGNGEFDGNENGKDDITGGSGNDVIDAGNGEDSLTGGAGDDILTGGHAADTFNYSFTLSTSSGSGPQSYAAYLAETLGKTASELSQNEFSTSYSAWLEYLVFGDDAWQGLAEYFGWEGEVTIGLNQNDHGGSAPHISVDGVLQDLDAIFGDAQQFSWSKGKATQTRTFWDLDDGYSWGGGTTVSSTDGKDTITDFSVAQEDKLHFTIDIDDALLGGDMTQVTNAFKAQFDITKGDFDGDAVAEGEVDTKMVLDGSMSITLLGYTGGDAIWDHVEFHFV